MSYERTGLQVVAHTKIGIIRCVGGEILRRQKNPIFHQKNDNYTASHNQNYPNPLNQVRKI